METIGTSKAEEQYCLKIKVEGFHIIRSIHSVFQQKLLCIVQHLYLASAAQASLSKNYSTLVGHYWLKISSYSVNSSINMCVAVWARCQHHQED